jgi:hypothetical protein
MYKKCWIKNMYQCIATKNMIFKNVFITTIERYISCLNNMLVHTDKIKNSTVWEITQY